MVIKAFPPATDHQLSTSLGMAFSQATNLYDKPKYMISVGGEGGEKKGKLGQSQRPPFLLIIFVMLCPLWE